MTALTIKKEMGERIQLSVSPRELIMIVSSLDAKGCHLSDLGYGWWAKEYCKLRSKLNPES